MALLRSRLDSCAAVPAVSAFVDRSAPGTGESPRMGSPAEARSRAVWVFLDNDVKVRAPVDAIAFANRLDLGSD
ncbi:MAG: hypothetical protein M3R63_01125 [Actinomycetota bacterium]|nr:hypothetical protein [Actinomycetota bacterium]